MLQRIQSIYLGLAFIAMGLMFVFPIALYTVGDQSYVLDVFGMEVGGVNVIAVPLYIIAGVIGLLTLVAVFLYKKRANQLRISSANFVFLLVFVGAVYWITGGSIESIPRGEGVVGNVAYGVGFFMPVVALAFSFLANRAIRKDERLVQSLDRLR
jgi:hypothetical protein